MKVPVTDIPDRRFYPLTVKETSMSTRTGSLIAGVIPPHGMKRNDGGKPSRSKYAGMKPSEQKNTSGQRRERRKKVV